MPSGNSKRVRIRMEEVAHLLRVRGCVLTRDVAALGYTRTQAENTLRCMVFSGRAVRVRVGRVALWCADHETAVKHIEKLRYELHAALCRANVKFVVPKKALKIVLNDKKASKLFTSLSLDAASLSFVNSLLALTYGNPAFAGPTYVVNCRKKLPPLRL